MLTTYRFRPMASLRLKLALGAVMLMAVPCHGLAQTYTDLAATPRKVDAQPISASRIIVSWDDVTTNETGFVVERKLASAPTWTPLNAPAASGTGRRTFRDTATLSAGTSYQYRVKALGATATPVASAIFTITTPSVDGRIRYVGPTSDIFPGAAAPSDASSADGSALKPWLTLNRAGEDVVAGQTVLVRKTTNDYTWNFSNIATINAKVGSASAWTKFKAFPGERPKLKLRQGFNINGFRITNSSYVMIDGFEIQGQSREIFSDVNGKAPASLIATIENAPANDYTGVGIGIDGDKNLKNSHHIVVRNMIMYDLPQGGANANASDYITFENNRVYNSGDYSIYGGSGLSIFTPMNLDTASGYHNIIRNNVIYDIQNQVKCQCFLQNGNLVKITDGNGIILDRFIAAGYTGRTLVSNNISYGNGGRGIHVFKSRNVDIVFNTVGDNSKTVGLDERGEITAQESNDVKVYNNLTFTTGSKPVNFIGGSTNVAFLNNKYAATNDLITSTANGNDVKLSNNQKLSTSLSSIFASTATYQLTSSSPAANTANESLLSSSLPTNDVYFAPRPKGAKRDVGAVESQ
jgi:Right handed beta helix region